MSAGNTFGSTAFSSYSAVWIRCHLNSCLRSKYVLELWPAILWLTGTRIWISGCSEESLFTFMIWQIQKCSGLSFYVEQKIHSPSDDRTSHLGQAYNSYLGL
ncbi:hypothetical protein MPTK1_8g09790 [Marchantia polymorpha subsp. ruderalis]|uniref:Uncharacterized protein n=1 Tax=Marchantia polymorpha TaxID=3197 RepID=A0A2R6XN92_MARPO|nr:hypothetical protein MARPO_0008s0242 [Marchantia polymorpha]BBN19337.1 hypothetical protein Mp_8g09790 [Marchantia polymorpha subsp. ruderalis]|eukprot:PTQ47496.1 hypothetical protein MARPO_0008s0242 [Marchantia polymorpha]